MAELARRVKVSRQAVSSAVNRGTLRKVGEGRSAKIDLHDQLTVNYIKDNSSNRQVSKQEKGNPEAPGSVEESGNQNNDFGGESAIIRDKKLRAQTRKIEMEMAEKMGDLIPRKDVERAFSLISSSLINYIYPLGERMAPIIAGLFESIDQKKINETKLTLEKEISRALEAVKKDITDSL